MWLMNKYCFPLLKDALIYFLFATTFKWTYIFFAGIQWPYMQPLFVFMGPHIVFVHMYLYRDTTVSKRTCRGSTVCSITSDFFPAKKKSRRPFSFLKETYHARIKSCMSYDLYHRWTLPHAYLCWTKIMHDL